ncbi:MAG: YvcK family protein [Candidatus Omnitrophica bacterium]|nr:YvcK family protein [Candidatus Omnitrophota bacterium]
MKKFIKVIKWFYPGLRVKRWVSLLLLSLFFLIFSAVRLSFDTLFLLKVFDLFLLVISFIGVVVGLSFLMHSFFQVVYPQNQQGMIDLIYEKRFLSRGPKIVAIGGGTGLSTLLEGLKKYTANITAIVTVADEGGSSGRLREEFGILPPGDIRNCLVSLAETPQLMRDLFQYRFKEGQGIKGHSFGNLFITAMTQVSGSFKDAIKESSIILAIRGKVLPSSLLNLRIKADYLDGTTTKGENRIPQNKSKIKRLHLMPEDAKANPEAIAAVKKADIIIFGPGSLFTSVIPNLLIKNLRDAISRRQVMKLYICNVMTQEGETDDYTAADHLQQIISHTNKDIINCFLVNSGRLTSDLLSNYAQQKSFPVLFDRKRLRKMGVSIYEADVINRIDHLRHNPYKTAREIIRIYNKRRKKWLGLRNRF